MKPRGHKSVSFAVTVVYSLIFHAMVLGSVLTMPIYGGEKHIESYLVYLPESDTETPKSKVKPRAEEDSKVSAPLPERKRPANALEDASGIPEPEEAVRVPKALEKKSVIQPELQDETEVSSTKADIGETAPAKLPEAEEKRPVESKNEPETVSEEKTEPVKEKAPRPESVARPWKEPPEESPTKTAQRIEEPVVKEERPLPAEKKTDVARDEEESSVEATEASEGEKEPEEVHEKLSEEAGWQETVEKSEPEKEKESVAAIGEPEPLEEPDLSEPERVMLSKLYENPAEEIIRQQESAISEVPAMETTTGVSPAEESLCKDCSLVAKLYKNPLVDIMKEFEVPPRAPEEEGTPAVLPSSMDICQNCDVVSSMYENLASEMLSYRPVQETPYGLMPGEEDGTGAASEIDLLCTGCFLVAMLDENPAEGIIYDYGPRGQTRAVGGFLSVIQEFCSECVRPFESTGDVKYRIWDPSESEMVESVEMIALDSRKETPGSIVVEVPEAELVQIITDNDVAVESKEVDVPDEMEMETPFVEIFTPAENRTPSVDDYLAGLDKNLKRLEEPEPSQDKGEGPGLPLYSPRDMEIRVFYDGSGEGVSFKIMRRPHPMEEAGGKATEITGETEEMIINEGSGLRRIFSLARAEKGVYIFIIENDGSEALGLSMSFVLYGGLTSERAKEYEEIEIDKAASREVKFLMPEAIFWDDDDFFTGEIEGPNWVTKFNDETGLVWKEKSGGY